jgi:hypothetical protein
VSDIQCSIYTVISYLLRFVTRRYNVHNLHLTRDILPITDRHRQLVVLRARVLEVLHGDWPQSLVGWDHLQSHIHGLSQALAQDTEPHSTYFHTLPNAAVALRLAREHQIPTILPSVFASIAMIPSMCNIDFDDVFTIPGFDHPARSNPRYRTVDWSLLDVQDMERIRQGQCWFRNQIRQIITVVSVSGSSYVLPNHAQCINALARLLTGDEIVDHYFHADPLGLWKLIIDRSRAEGFGLCAECATLVSSYAGHSRQYVWDMLGQIFDL